MQITRLLHLMQITQLLYLTQITQILQIGLSRGLLTCPEMSLQNCKP